MKENIEFLLNGNDIVIPEIIFKVIVDNNLKINLSDFMILVFLYNDKEKIFNVEELSKFSSMNEKDIMMSIDNLMKSGLISIENNKDSYGKLIEVVSLKGLYELIYENINKTNTKKKNSNIFEIFEKELKRTLSPMEYEIINAWLDNNTSEEIILGALKEAVYNGVSNFRYIDKIIYEWGKKGFKTMDDVNVHLTKKDDSKSRELFDYNWLDENEE